MDICTTNTRRMYKKPSSAWLALLTLALAFTLAACEVTPPPAPTSTPASVATSTPVPEAEPTRVVVAPDLPLPTGWEAVGAATVPDDAQGLTAAGPTDAFLTVLVLPRRGLSLARYVEDARAQLEGAGLAVARAGVVYDLRDDGAPAGLLEYAGQGVDHVGIQWVIMEAEQDQLWTVTLAAKQDNMSAVRPDVEAWLGTLELPTKN